MLQYVHQIKQHEDIHQLKAEVPQFCTLWDLNHDSPEGRKLKQVYKT